MTKQSPSPRQTSENESQAKRKKCFVITPIGEAGSDQRKHADMVFHIAIKPACEMAGLDGPVRADHIDTTSMISTNIFRAVEESEIAVADLTFLNANVFYELGMRHAFELPVVHIAGLGTSLPFDTAGHMTTFFDVSDHTSLVALRDRLASQFSTILSEGYEVSNPLTQARGRKDLRHSADSSDQMLSELLTRMDGMERSMTESRRKIPNIYQSHNLNRLASIQPIYKNQGSFEIFDDSDRQARDIMSELTDIDSSYSPKHKIPNGIITELSSRISKLDDIGREIISSYIDRLETIRPYKSLLLR